MACASYLRKLFTVDGYEQTVSLAVRQLSEHTAQFDAIAFTGASGTLVGPTIARALGKQILMLRKSENSHSGHLLEGHYEEGLRYIVVDDLVSSGDTLRRILHTIGHYSSGKSQCVGVYLYEHEDNTDVDELLCIAIQNNIKVAWVQGVKIDVAKEEQKRLQPCDSEIPY